MKITHYKRTPIAWAPDAISDCINKYTNHESYINENFKNADIIHYHNKYINIPDVKKYDINIKQIIKKPSFILYHSFPEIVHNYSNIVPIRQFIYDLYRLLFRKSPSIFIDKNNNKSYKVKQMVIGQYQATLPIYKGYKIVRNIIDFYTDRYKIQVNNDDCIRIGFSPSNVKKRSKWETKGLNRTTKVLKKIKNRFPNIKFDIIRNVSLEDCLIRKSNCDIIIDECVTASFHRSGLEGLALGKMTICSLDDKVINILKKVSKSDQIPFENIWINDLFEELSKIIYKGKKNIHQIGEDNRKWMEKYWNPRDIVNEYIDYYKLSLKKQIGHDLITLEEKISLSEDIILIIANGPSATLKKYGQLIDKFKVIGRINNYTTNKYDNFIGSRTDIWFNGANQGLNKRKNFPKKTVVLVPAEIQYEKEQRVIERTPKRIGLPIEEYHLVSKEEMKSFESTSKIIRPTTGLSSILWSLAHYEKVIIHGFDFFLNTQEHYYDSKVNKYFVNKGLIKRGTKHDNLAEKNFVKKLIKQGRVTTLDSYFNI